MNHDLNNHTIGTGLLFSMITMISNMVKTSGGHDREGKAGMFKVFS